MSKEQLLDKELAFALNLWFFENKCKCASLEEAEAEYDLILKKESKLSANNRAQLVRLITFDYEGQAVMLPEVNVKAVLKEQQMEKEAHESRQIK